MISSSDVRLCTIVIPEVHVSPLSRVCDPKSVSQKNDKGLLLRYEAATLPEVDDHLAHFQALQARMARGSSDAM